MDEVQPGRDRGLTRKQLVVRTGAAAAAFSLGPYLRPGFGQAALMAGTPRRGGTLKMALNAANETYDPLTPNLQIDSFVVYHIYRALTKYDTSVKDWVPDMAEDMHVSADGKTWTFKLRKGILFHDLKEMTSADVVFTAQQWINPKNASFISGLLPAGIQPRARGKYGVEFVLPHPSVQLPAAISRDAGAIFTKRHFATRATKPVGTGPFKFVEFVKGQRTVLKRFDHFFEGAPYLDQIEFVTIPEDTARVAALLSGQVQAIDETPFQQIKSLKANKHLQMRVFPSSMVDGILFNCTRAPFNAVGARQAIAHAIDVHAINQVATFGYGTINPTFIPTSFPFAPNVQQPSYNVQLAKTLAQQNGLQGKSLQILTSNTAFPPWGRACEYIVAACSQIGVNVSVTDLDLGTYVQRIFTTKDYDMAYIGVIGSPEADQRTYPFFSAKGTLNWTGYNGGPAFENLLLQQREAVNNRPLRQKLVTHIWRILTTQVPWYFTYAWPGAQALSQNVQNFKTDPEDFPFFDKVWLAR